MCRGYTIIVVVIMLMIIIIIIMMIIIMLIIIMIIHLFPGAFQDMRGRLAKQSGKRDTHMSMG